MNKLKNGWKIFAIHNETQLKSFVLVDYPIIYKRHEWNYPREGEGPLACFTQYETAEKFVITEVTDFFFPHTTILKVLYKPSDKCVLSTFTKHYTITKDTAGKIFIEKETKYPISKSISTCPTGTVLADAVFIL